MNLTATLQGLAHASMDLRPSHRQPNAGNMTRVAQTLSEKDIENLAHYITSLR